MCALLQVSTLKAQLASAEQAAQGATSREHELLGRVKALSEASAAAAQQHAQVQSSVPRAEHVRRTSLCGVGIQRPGAQQGALVAGADGGGSGSCGH